MKTINYKKGKVMRTIVASLIIMASFSGITRGENSNKGANGIMESTSTLNVESSVNYNAAKFAEAEMVREIENWMNGNDETRIEIAEPELAPQAVAYNAKDFAEAELAIETENWLNSNVESSDNVAEAELAQQVEMYNAADFVAADMAAEAENWTNYTRINNGSEDRINCYRNMACK
jgi:hypothetical protein